jgi:hypothetical protein
METQFNVILSSKRPCHLVGGEVRRVSQDLRYPLVAYHVCCPRCNFVSVAFQNHEGLVITEGQDARHLSFTKPLRCIYCAILIHVDRGKFRLEADGNERNLRFR